MDDEESGLNQMCELFIKNPMAEFKCYLSWLKPFKELTSSNSKTPTGLFQGFSGIHEFCNVLELDKYISFLIQQNRKIFRTKEISSLK